jgi:hypothetical protein
MQTVMQTVVQTVVRTACAAPTEVQLHVLRHLPRARQRDEEVHQGHVVRVVQRAHLRAAPLAEPRSRGVAVQV